MKRLILGFELSVRIVDYAENKMKLLNVIKLIRFESHFPSRIAFCKIYLSNPYWLLHFDKIWNVALHTI